VPTIVTCNARTIPQERHNARLVGDGGLGVAVRHWREIPGALTAFRREPGRLDGCRRRLAALPPNRAVYEVLDLIDQALTTHGGPSGRYELPRPRAGDGSSQGTGSTQ
jgi:hypothetical protein